MRTADAHKTVVRGYHSSGIKLINFSRNVEFGVLTNIIDSKFLSSYKIYESSSFGSGSSSIHVEPAIGLETSEKNILNFDGKYINNAFIGPSSQTGSKETYDIRPTRAIVSAEVNDLAVDVDMNGTANNINFDGAYRDDIIVSIRPLSLTETYGNAFPFGSITDTIANTISANFIARKPIMMNVTDHSNTLIGNIDKNDTDMNKNRLIFPATAQGSINPNLLYRFSFYYRIKGSINLIITAQYFTNIGGFISNETINNIDLSGDDTEISDFNFIDSMIPKTKIPEEASMLRLVFTITASEDSIFEIAYPIVEHSFNSSPAVSIMLPEQPSSIGYKDISSSELKTSIVGTNYSFDSSKLFFGHNGRKLFNIVLSYSLMDSNILDQLRTIENYNQKGFPVVLRPQHHDLPPVLIGNIDIDNSNPSYDYHYNDVNIKFEESI